MFLSATLLLLVRAGSNAVDVLALGAIRHILGDTRMSWADVIDLGMGVMNLGSAIRSNREVGS